MLKAISKERLAVSFAALLLGVAPLAGFAAKKEEAKPVNAQLNVEKSSVAWIGKKVTGAHNGTLRLKSGQIELADGTLKGGKFELDMSSIKVLDIQDPEYNGKLTGHLKSDDFFGIEKHPVATFVIKDVKPKKAKETTHEITGDLTIKGITHPVTFPAKVEIQGKRAKAQASVKIDRTKYDIRYGSGKFFQNLGDKMIDDQFQVDLNLVSEI